MPNHWKARAEGKHCWNFQLFAFPSLQLVNLTEVFSALSSETSFYGNEFFCGNERTNDERVESSIKEFFFFNCHWNQLTMHPHQAWFKEDLCDRQKLHSKSISMETNFSSLSHDSERGEEQHQTSIPSPSFSLIGRRKKQFRELSEWRHYPA